MTGETIVAEVRASLLVYLRPIMVGGALLLAVSYALFWLLEQGKLGQVVVSIGYAVGVYLLLSSYTRWRNTVLIITTDRVVDVYKEGILRKEVTAVRLRDIEDVGSSIRGFWKTICQIGQLKIEASEDVVILVDNVRRPARIQDTLQKLISHEDVSTDRLSRDRVVSYFKHLSAPNLDTLIREAMEILKEKRNK